MVPHRLSTLLMSQGSHVQQLRVFSRTYLTYTSQICIRGGGGEGDDQRKYIIISPREGRMSASTGLNTVKRVLFARLLSGRRLFLDLLCSCCCLHPQNLPNQHLHGYLRGSIMTRLWRCMAGCECPCTRAAHEQPVDSVVVDQKSLQMCFG